MLIMEITLVKYWSSIAVKGIVITLACLFVFRYCGGCDNHIVAPKTDNSHLFAKMKSDSLIIVSLMEKSYQDSLKVHASKLKEDSLIEIKDKFEVLYRKSSKVVREEMSEGILDTNSVKVALNDCDSLNISNQKVISQKDSTNNALSAELETVKEEKVVLTSENETARIIINNLMNDNKSLEKESKKALRRQKIKTIGVIILATLTEALTIFALK